jgi:hypothetical protein
VGDLHIRGRLRNAIHPDRLARNVDQPAFRFDEEVVVVRGIGVEIGALSADGDLAQKARA